MLGTRAQTRARAAEADARDFGPILDAVRDGDVLLLSARWLMARAGFEEEEEVETDRQGRYIHNCIWQRKKWFSRREARPLPCRQQIETEHPEAIMSVDEIWRLFTQLRRPRVSHFDAVPVVSVSHCWETPQAPDPEARTLRIVAEALAGKLEEDILDDEDDRVGLPYYEYLGFDDMAVFFDFSSLYQNKPTPLTPTQEASFKRAHAKMWMWYRNMLTTVVIVRGQDDHLRKYAKDEKSGELVRTDELNPRDGRGWPCCDEAMAHAFKQAKPPGTGWNKVVEAGGASGQVQRPPMAPSRFADLLQTLVFTDGSDREVVSGLYRRTLEEGFNVLLQLHYSGLGWGDAEVEALGATLREVPCSRVVMLDLSHNSLTSASALASIFGELPSLKRLTLTGCRNLAALPDALSSLSALEELSLDSCEGLTALPDAVGNLSALWRLDLRKCGRLTTLPGAICGLSALRQLFLDGQGADGSRLTWYIVDPSDGEVIRSVVDLKHKLPQLAVFGMEFEETCIEEEEAAVAKQQVAGGPILRRLRGDLGVCAEHNVQDRTLAFDSFCTFGLSGASTSSGVAYFEIEVVEELDAPQLGFAALGFKIEVDEELGDGVGQCADSWGVDGQRSKRWHVGEQDWVCAWSEGDVIGLAANVDTGQIAVSKNGSWTATGCGVVFEGDGIQGGVYPALSAQGGKLCYRFGAPFQFAPPPSEVWL